MTGEQQHRDNLRDLSLRFLNDADAGGTGFIEKWMAPDYRCHAQSVGDPLDRDEYRRLCEWFTSAFSELRHDVFQIVVEGSQACVFSTTHVVHSGDFEGKAATGKSLTFTEAIMLRFEDSRIVEEWLVMDLAALRSHIIGKPEVL